MPALAYDFGGVFMSASIITADGERIPLWTNLNPDGSPKLTPQALDYAGLTSLPFVTEISVALKLNALPTIRCVLTPPHRDALAILDSRLLEWGQARLQVQFGYAGGAQGVVISPVFSGVLLKPEIEVGSDFTITLNAQGGGSSFVQGSISRTFINTPRREVIAEMAKGSDPDNPRDIEVDFSEADKDDVSKGLLDTALASYKVDSKSDFETIYEVVHAARCWFWMDDRTIHVVPRAKKFSDTPKHVFSLYDFPGGAIGPSVQVGDKSLAIYPILTLSSPMAEAFMSGASKAVIQQGMGSGDRRPIKTFFDNTTVEVPRVGAGLAVVNGTPTMPGINPETGDGAMRLATNPENPNEVAKATAEYEESTADMGLQFDVGSIGVPDLLPAEVIALRGVGKRLSEGGNYAILEMTHTISAGGFETTFKCVTNSSKLDEYYGVGADAAANTKEPEESSQTVTAQPTVEE